MSESTNLPARLGRALIRLGSALDHLDAAVARRAQMEAARGNLEDELAVMADDRARLAHELDGALARCRSLAGANAEVAGRLDRVGGTVKTILADMRPDASDDPA